MQTYGNMTNHRLSCDSHFDYLGCMRLCISIASILLVTTPAVAVPAVSVVVVEGSLAAFDEDQFAAQVIRRKAGSQHTLRILGWLHRL